MVNLTTLIWNIIQPVLHQCFINQFQLCLIQVTILNLPTYLNIIQHPTQDTIHHLIPHTTQLHIQLTTHHPILLTTQLHTQLTTQHLIQHTTQHHIQLTTQQHIQHFLIQNLIQYSTHHLIQYIYQYIIQPTIQKLILVIHYITLLPNHLFRGFQVIIQLKSQSTQHIIQQNLPITSMGYIQPMHLLKVIHQTIIILHIQNPIQYSSQHLIQHIIQLIMDIFQFTMQNLPFCQSSK